MKSFNIRWKASAKKELKKIDRVEIPKILNEIEKISINPYPMNYRKLMGAEHIYRIIYSIENEKLIIEIIRVRHRKEVYRKRQT